MNRLPRILAPLALAACSTAAPPPYAHTATAEVLARAAEVPGLQTLHRDVGLRCDPVATSDVDVPRCEALRIDERGTEALPLNDVVAAARLDADRILTLGSTLELALDDGRGGREVLARGAIDPRVAGDGRRVLYTQLSGAPDAYVPGMLGALVVHDTVDGTVRVVSDHPLDSQPFAIPGGDEVLFVSGRTALASLWRAVPGAPAVQVTNVGRTTVDADFVPVPGRELVWLPGTRTAVFTAHYGTPTLWALDVDSGRAWEVGPGRLPAPAEGGVIAVHDRDGSPHIVRYAVEVL